MENETENMQAEAIATLVAFNKTIDSKRVHQGNKPITLFTLAAFGIKEPFTLREIDLPGGEKAVEPEYKNKRLQYLQDSLSQRVKASAMARYKVNEGAETNIDDLITGRGGSSYLSELAAFRQAVAAFLTSLGNPPAAVAVLVKKLDPSSIGSADSHIQQQVANAINAFQEKAPGEAEGHTDMIQRMVDGMEKDDSAMLDALSF